MVSEDDPETRYFSVYPGDFFSGASSNDPSGSLCRVLCYLVKQINLEIKLMAEVLIYTGVLIGIVLFKHLIW